MTYTAGYASNVFIPGVFKHGIVYVGGLEERTSAGAIPSNRPASVIAPSARLEENLARGALADGSRADLRADPLPTPFHMTRALLRYRHLDRSERSAAGAAMVALAGRRGGARDRLDDTTFGDWLRRHGQSERAITAFWDIVVLATCNDRSDDVSAALAAFVFQEGVLSATDAGAIGWSLVGLSRLVDPAVEDYLRARGGRARARQSTGRRVC